MTGKPPGDKTACPHGGFTSLLAFSLTCENLAFTTFAIMQQIHRAGGASAICDISQALNLSYHAITHQARRTPYFSFDRTGQRVRLSLNACGLEKMGRMEKRLARETMPGTSLTQGEKRQRF
jgi:hypothetical protein